MTAARSTAILAVNFTGGTPVLRRIFEAGTSPEPVFWGVVEGWLGGESPFFGPAGTSAALMDDTRSDACGSSAFGV